MSRWFRWHEGTCEDGKFRVVARNAGVTVATVMGVWAALLEDASHDDHRGVAVRGEDFYAAILDLGEELQRILEQMDRANLIACCTNDTIEITRWKERQYETDTTDGTNAARQRRWREKHKSNGKITERNGTVTEAKRPETDTETDTEQKDTEAKASAPIGAASIDGEVTEAFVYRLGQTVLGAGSGGQITKLRKMFRHDLDKIHSVLLQAQDKGNAREWIAGVLKGSEFAKPTMDEICPPDIYRNVL